jgi:hypothetical protein
LLVLQLLVVITNIAIAANFWPPFKKQAAAKNEVMHQQL